MKSFRRLIALFVLVAFLPAAAFAQGCATRCMQFSNVPAVTVAVADIATSSMDHCATKTASKKSDCPFKGACDFAQISVMVSAPIQFVAAAPSYHAVSFDTGFFSLTHPPALRPPAA